MFFFPVDFHFTVSPLPLLPARYALQHMHICHLPSCRGPYFEDRLVPLHPTPPAKGNVNSCMCSWHNCDSFSAMGPWLSSNNKLCSTRRKACSCCNSCLCTTSILVSTVRLLVQTCRQKKTLFKKKSALPTIRKIQKEQSVLRWLVVLKKQEVAAE